MEQVNVRTNIKRGDSVVVIAGKNKGKKGKVISVNPDDNTCVVDGVNIVIKHKKARSAQQKSSRDKKAGNIDISNVMILCKCGKATRVSRKEVGGKMVRYCKKCDEILDKKFVKTKEKVKEVEAKEEEKADKKPLKRREVKATAESTVKTKEEK
ncbi:MAG: 50S ribosomal protein L24 [Firmicutes bacterium]|nr:50S ribosomal protein L24 [Bacillota bacterium]